MPALSQANRREFLSKPSPNRTQQTTTCAFEVTKRKRPLAAEYDDDPKYEFEDPKLA